MAEAMQGWGVRRFGAFELNLQLGELRKNGMRLRLSGQSFQVLAVLVEHAGEVVTREELHSKLWPADTFVDFDHGLNNAVARIREALNDSADTPRYIETIPRRGYRFITPVPVQPASVPPGQAEPAQKAIGAAVPAPPATKPARLWLKLLLAGAASIALLAAAFLVYRRFGVTERTPIRSLAVLPLKNLSGDPAQEYLADGMTEEVIGRLASLRDLRVISRTSSMRFKDTKLSAPEIAKTLGVDALVEGSVIREGDRIRVHAQLIRGASDEHFWSESYDREMGDVLALESNVAQSIAEKIAVTITGQEQARLAAVRDISPEVYEAYLKGKLGPHNTRAELQQNRAYFEEAIQKDPTFAPAYLGLANTYEDLSTIFVGGPPRNLRPKVISAAREALELDPELAEAHVLLADVYQREWRWNQAETEYKRALQLKPNDPVAHLGFAKWLLCQGRLEEALAWARRGRELDPLGDAGISISWILLSERRYDEGIRELQSFLAVHPDSAPARWYLGIALVLKGQPDRGIPELQRTVVMMHRSPGPLAFLATGLCAYRPPCGSPSSD
jgi:TolB-like protein/DNA-binding winged helix-turn-helix (wHTH) protein